MNQLDEKTFDTLASDALKSLEKALTDIDGLEADLAADILKIEFERGTPFIVNSHRAARQIWLSADMHAWHFSPMPGGWWIDTREQHELWGHLAKLVSARLGRTVKLSAE